MSKIENAKTDRVLRDDELDLVSGGGGYYLENAWPIKTDGPAFVPRASGFYDLLITTY